MRVGPATIQDLARRIGRDFHPERVVLFGSYAAGTPHEGSDVDLLIVMPFEGRRVKKAYEILRSLDTHVPLDIVLRTPKEMRERIAWGDFFLREITAKGEVLYESSHA